MQKQSRAERREELEHTLTCIRCRLTSCLSTERAGPELSSDCCSICAHNIATRVR